MSKVTKPRPKSKNPFQMVNPHAAGIDIGSTMHVVAVPPHCAQEPVRIFGSFTEDLHAIARYLLECGITSVAMESTGVYWKPLFSVLIQHNLEVCLANAKQTQNVAGRKTDINDAQWIQQLHSYGLLKSSFLPDDFTESIRHFVRHRKNLLRDSNRYVLRMQKSLELMNVKIHSVINDITGKTGTAIIEAIINGERKAANFLQYVDVRIKASHDKIEQSLQGNWREEHLFTLQQCYETYRYFQQQIKRCDHQIEQLLRKAIAKTPPPAAVSDPLKKSPLKKRKPKNQPAFNAQHYLHLLHGVDVTSIHGISETCALAIVAETGTDLCKWDHESKFVAWLNLCPNNKITGGKLISSKVLKKRSNNATEAFRSAANSLYRSNSWLGNYFRRMKAKGGNKYAIVATARKLALIYYKMVRYKVPFIPIDVSQYDEKYKKAKIAVLERRLAELRKEVA